MTTSGQTLPGLLRRRAESDPARLFLQDTAGTALTYGEAYEAMLRWANAFARQGVADGDRVVTMVPNCVDATSIWAGLAAMGAWEVPINTAYIGKMLIHAVNTVEPDVMVITRAHLGAVREVVPQLKAKTIVVVDDDDPPRDFSCRVLSRPEFLDGAVPVELAREAQVWNVAAIIYTSGTTGPSKGVVVPWGQVHAFAIRAYPIDDLNGDDAIYCFTPSYHIGARCNPHMAALLGGRIVMAPSFRLDNWWSDIRSYECTTSGAIGTMANYLCQQDPKHDDAESTLRNLVMAPLVPDLDGFKERFGVRICTAYAMTEVPPPFASPGWSTKNWKSCGMTKAGYPGVEIRIVDEHDFDVGPGAVGELIVRTSEPWAINQGYFGDAEATARAWRNGWFHSGDAFTYDDAGYYYFVDRIKDAIRRRGENISSFEVEAHVLEHPSVVECAAVAVSAELGEDEVKVFVVAAPGEALAPDELLDFLRPKMPRFMIPRFVEMIDELPKTATMRVQKSLLRQREPTDQTWDREASAPAHR